MARLGAGLEAAAGLAEVLGEVLRAAEPGADETDGAADGTRTAGRIVAELPACDEAVQSVAALLSDDPPATFEEGGVVRAGVDAELDRLRGLLRQGRPALAAREQRDRAAPGIANLKNRIIQYLQQKA